MKLLDFIKEDDIVLSNTICDTFFGKPCCNSSRVEPGDIFFAIDKGKKYISDAIKNGAKAIICDEIFDGVDIVLKEIRHRFAEYCANYYNHPEKRLKIVAVVGTNGKTSITMILSGILKNNSIKVATIGTLGADIAGERYATGFTTPDSDILFCLLNKAVEKGVEVVVMELSAHAIYLNKAYAIDFDVGIFTNCTQDHLDFFQTMDKYVKTKASIFLNKSIKTAIINVDDYYGKSIISQRNGTSISYGLYAKSDYMAKRFDRTKSNYYVNNNLVNTNLCGEYNVYNVLACIASAVAIGLDFTSVVESIKSIEEIPGRYNVIKDKGITIVIDYAHTPDGLEKVLIAAREMTQSRLISVFGCGGNRDKGKRSIMGKVSDRYADITILTSDNPRFENPQDIIDQIKAGFASINYTCIVDRDDAIQYAISIAGEGDVIVVAGKGAEDYIDEGGVKRPYSDRSVCEKYLRSRN